MNGLPDDLDDGPETARLLAAMDAADGESPALTTDEEADDYVDTSTPPLPVDGDGIWTAECATDDPVAVPQVEEVVVAAPIQSFDIDAAQILRDRPDVYAGFYKAFYGANNDRHSPAWFDRVGGYSPEDYARYWYSAHGRYEGYTQNSQGAVDEVSVGDSAPVGRTTIDGIPLSKILADRPDVFQAFFTEYYGPHNDRHSDAWVQRVGGTTVEDYANYWYNAHGRVEGYVPSGAQAPGGGAGPIGTPLDPNIPDDPNGLPYEDPSLDPWNHPAIYPDWQPPYPGWVAPDGSVWPRPADPDPGAGGTPSDGAGPDVPSDPPPVFPDAFARPLVVHLREDGVDLLPATDEELAAMVTLFEPSAF